MKCDYMNDHQKVEELLEKYFKGNASKEECELITEWKESSEANSEEFIAAQSYWELTNRLLSMQQIDIDKAREKVKRQIGEFRRDRSLWQYWSKIAAVLFIPLLLSIGFVKFINKKDISNDKNLLEFRTAMGVRAKVFLSDGTMVWLNSGSSLKYPKNFGPEKREVFLLGEAYFDVKKNRNCPFYVNLGELSVKATGTSFDITAYPENSTYETTLLTGKVELVKKDPKNSEVVIQTMHPNQHAVYFKGKKLIQLTENIQLNPQTVQVSDNQKNSASKADSTTILTFSQNKYTSWIDGKLIFHNDPMDEVVKRLGRWYNVEIVLKDTLLYDFRYTATFTNETLIQVMDLLVLSAPLKYKISERKENNDNSFTKETVTLQLKYP